jgi:uroporphyrinogen decarboxylase
LPQRLGVDAIIFFQDILTPLAPMGAEFVFRPGPVLERPVRTPADVDRLESYAVSECLDFVAETFERIHGQLDGALPVLGFAGAPWTLAVFLIEGKSFGEHAPAALDFSRRYPEAAHRLLEKLTVITVDYLHYQIEAGAAAVQLFESAANILSEPEYREFALPYQQRIFAALHGQAPTIAFARELADLDLLNASGADVLSLPSSVSIREARSRLGAHRVVQGNVSNQLVRRGPLEAIAEAVHRCIDEGERRAHILNLDHGLLRDTPYAHVQHLVDCVRNY